MSLAEGGEDPEAAAHARGCASCASRLEEIRRLLPLVGGSAPVAPEALLAQAKAMGRHFPRLVARLLGNGLTSSGARRGASRDFALHVGVEGFTIRLHYAPTPGGWEVLGRAPTPGWSVAHEGGEVPCGPSGRFRLIAAGLDGTMFSLRKDGIEIQVPSAQEMIEIGS